MRSVARPSDSSNRASFAWPQVSSVPNNERVQPRPHGAAQILFSAAPPRFIGIELIASPGAINVKPSSIATVIAATTCMGGFATAQEWRSDTLTIANGQGELHRLSHIIGKDAHDARGEDLGRVRNV